MHAMKTSDTIGEKVTPNHQETFKAKPQIKKILDS